MLLKILPVLVVLTIAAIQLVYLFMFSFDKANNENEDLINIFRVYDREGKGCIDVDELKNVWNNYLKDNIPDESVSIKFESYLCRLPVKS